MKYENKKSKRKNYYTGFKCLEILLKNRNVSSGLFQRLFNEENELIFLKKIGAVQLFFLNQVNSYKYQI